MTVASTHLRVLGGFELRVHDQSLDLPQQAQRVLGYLAVSHEQVSRSTVAGTLWAEVPQAQANANLRNAIWRIRQTAADVLRSTRTAVGLHESVGTDLRAARLCAEGVLRGDEYAYESIAHLLDHDLLPSWDEPWLLIERERLRQLRMHALEELSGALRQAGHHSQAISAALAAVQAEPLRESGQRALVVAHLAEGNVSEAIRQFAAYRDLLWSELEIAPSDTLTALVHEAYRRQRDRAQAQHRRPEMRQA
ncbi:MAG: SARP family transcriptional regulator [Actinomycetota bacterium]|nr:SARP family transcriptional regulator [Actinomycetota bacterium]